ncbi:hypothetical protein DFH28DRAFT_1018175, partial [Melampsora americana]
MTQSNPSIDDLIIQHLNTLDQYQIESQSLEDQLSKAFFNLTRSKLSIGLDRINSLQYNLTPNQAIKQIVIDVSASDEDLSSSEQIHDLFSLRNHRMRLEDSDEAKMDLNELKSDEVSKVNEDSQGLLRHRRKANEDEGCERMKERKEKGSRSGVDEEIHQSDLSRLMKPTEVNLIDPIHQFTTLPPPSLRMAQSSFSIALETIIKLLNIRHRLDRLESTIHSHQTR